MGTTNSLPDTALPRNQISRRQEWASVPGEPVTREADVTGQMPIGVDLAPTRGVVSPARRSCSQRRVLGSSPRFSFVRLIFCTFSVVAPVVSRVPCWVALPPSLQRSDGAVGLCAHHVRAAPPASRDLPGLSAVSASSLSQSRLPASLLSTRHLREWSPRPHVCRAAGGLSGRMLGRGRHSLGRAPCALVVGERFARLCWPVGRFS